MDKVLFPIGDAAEVMDTLYPYFRVQEDGYEAVIAGPEKRIYHLVMHEIPPNTEWDITRESPGYHLEANIAFRDVKPEEYIGLFLSGGRAPEYIRYDEDLIQIVRHFFEHNKPVASVCHGAEIIATADVIRGKRLTTIPKCRFDVEICGGIFVDEPIVKTGNLVTGRSWHDNAAFIPEFMRMLNAMRDG